MGRHALAVACVATVASVASGCGTSTHLTAEQVHGTAGRDEPAAFRSEMSDVLPAMQRVDDRLRSLNRTLEQQAAQGDITPPAPTAATARRLEERVAKLLEQLGTITPPLDADLLFKQLQETVTATDADLVALLDAVGAPQGTSTSNARASLIDDELALAEHNDEVLRRF